MNRYSMTQQKNPYSQIEDLIQRWVGQEGLSKNNALGFNPQIEVQESKSGYEVRAELPGIKRDDLHVTFDDNTLYIRGEKTQETQRDDGKVFYSERSYGSFARSVPFTEKVDAAKVDAQFENGVLKIALPKIPHDFGGSKKINIK
jgi:HSP20 family protein